jgi:uncharacterized phage infection (PIP) family protein YhgE
MAKSDSVISDATRESIGQLAERLGRLAGTVQNKTEALQNKAEQLLDRQALHDEVTKVRDAAATLLEQLGDGISRVAGKTAPARKSAAKSSSNTKGRSGGFVDAPGKKHRKPMPSVKGRVNDARVAKLKMQHDSSRRRTPTKRG